MKCEVCGTEREGRDNGPVMRRHLLHHGRAVTYCADVVGCGEAGAMDYLDRIEASDQITDRMRTTLQEEGSVCVGYSPTIAGIMQMVNDLGLDPFKVTLDYPNTDEGIYVRAGEGA